MVSDMGIIDTSAKPSSFGSDRLMAEESEL